MAGSILTGKLVELRQLNSGFTLVFACWYCSTSEADQKAILKQFWAYIARIQADAVAAHLMYQAVSQPDTMLAPQSPISIVMSPSAVVSPMPEPEPDMPVRSPTRQPSRFTSRQLVTPSRALRSRRYA